MSKLGQIREMLDGAHVVNADGLREYHTARQVRDALRIKDWAERRDKIAGLLRNYRVTVSQYYAGGHRILIRSHDTRTSLEL